MVRSAPVRNIYGDMWPTPKGPNMLTDVSRDQISMAFCFGPSVLADVVDRTQCPLIPGRPITTLQLHPPWYIHSDCPLTSSLPEPDPREVRKYGRVRGGAREHGGGRKQGEQPPAPPHCRPPGPQPAHPGRAARKSLAFNGFEGDPQMLR